MSQWRGPVNEKPIKPQRPLIRGIFGALTPLVVADLMRGTGRYNVALGAVATMQGIGAATSGLVAGLIVDHFGYSAGFLTSGAAAAVALAALAFAMPETAEGSLAARGPAQT
jgi:MFS family permease